LEKFLARQPIFISGRIIYGCELLFRSGPDNYFSHPQPESAWISAMDNRFLIGIEGLAQGAVPSLTAFANSSCATASPYYPRIASSSKSDPERQLTRLRRDCGPARM
jgi:hypothetical protein